MIVYIVFNRKFRLFIIEFLTPWMNKRRRRYASYQRRVGSCMLRCDAISRVPLTTNTVLIPPPSATSRSSTSRFSFRRTLSRKFSRAPESSFVCPFPLSASGNHEVASSSRQSIRIQKDTGDVEGGAPR